MSENRTLRRKVRRTAGIAGLTAVSMVAAVVPSLALTNASWRDSEWDHAQAGTLDCTTAEFATAGAGRFLDGNVLAIDLDTIAEVEGVAVSNDGTTSTADPGTATPLGSDAYANPLSVSALSAINLALTGLLQLPLGADTGVYNQYGRAEALGYSAGASGAVNDSGGIALTPEPPGPDVPTSASLQLGTVLSTALGDSLGNLVTNLSDLQLRLGAVASSATLDACDAMWASDVYANLERDYLIAGLDLDVETALVADLVSTVQGTLTTLESAVTAVAGDAGVVNGVAGAVTGVLGPLLTGIGLGTPTTSLALTVDFALVQDLLDDVISDPDGIVEIDLASGVINIDIAALFDSANGLNSQVPNTQLLLNDTVINALTAAITTALADWVTDVIDEIDLALDLVEVDLEVVVPLDVLGTNLGTITVSVTDASLASLQDGTAEVTAGFAPDGLVCGLLPLACDLVNGVVTLLMTTSESALTLAIAGVLVPALDLATGATVTLLETSLQAITAPLVTLLADVLGFLFGEDAVLSILLNAQNAPDPAEAGPPLTHPEPAWAAGLQPTVLDPFQTGRFEVSALRLVVLGVVGDGVAIDLAHAGVGSNLALP